MKNLLLLFAAVALAGCAAVSAPATQGSSGTSTGSWYWWLHPKLGMVKVDRASNAMIISGKVQRDSTNPRAQ
jgi:uncharacterized protein YceK